MEHATGKLTLPHGVAEGDTLFWQKWLPDGDIKAIILLVHGYAEHSGRYTHVVDHLIHHGYGVYALDHWGHGQSDGEGGFIPAYSVLLDGVDTFYSIIRSEHPDLPMILLGHSMGGLIATYYLTQHQDKFSLGILSGPAIVPSNPPPAFVQRLAGLLSTLAPRLGVIPPMADGISRDQDVVAAYRNDPLVYQGSMGARMGHEILKFAADTQAAASAISLPLLILQGGKDTLTSPEGARLVHERVASKDKKLIEYPDLFHEVFNEPERAQVLNDMTDWLAPRIKLQTVGTV